MLPSATHKFKYNLIYRAPQVDTLGEGYDLPILSVVGILRPYMSLPPFYQFIGRATRVMTPNAMGASEAKMPNRMDNVAHIITHEVRSIYVHARPPPCPAPAARSSQTKFALACRDSANVAGLRFCATTCGAQRIWSI